MSRRPKLPIYAKSPVTRRTGEYFAEECGYGSVAELADSLPEGARIIDVGAGKSQFGARVCRRREDVDCANIDIRYFIPEVRRKLERTAPPNLRFVPADVLDLNAALEGEKFDRVYSDWLMPHINITSREAGIRAARNLLEAARPEDGQVAVGPGRHFRDPIFQVDMTDIAPGELDSAAEAMASVTTMGRLMALTLYASNVMFARSEKEYAVDVQHLAYAK